MDILRTVVLSPGGRPIQRVNLADPTGLTVYTERTTFMITPPTKQQNWSTFRRRMAGGAQSGESTDNFTAVASWWIKAGAGGNANTVLQNLEQLLAELDDASGLSPNQPKYLEWRPDGASNSTFFEIRGTGIYTPKYDWAAFTGAQMLKCDMSWPISPLGLGLPLDIADPFDVDSRADYTVDVGNALTYTAPVAYGGGSFSTAGAPAEQTVRHTVRNYSYDDVQVTAQFQIGTTVPTSIGVTLACLDANNHILVNVTSAGTLNVYKKVAGTYTLLATATPGAYVAGQQVWLRGRLEGNLVIAEYFAGTSGATPPGPLSPPGAQIRYALTGTDATAFGIGAGGGVGFRLQAPPADTLLQYFEALPYTYHAVRLPETVSLRGVPGSGPPRLAVQVTTAAPTPGLTGVTGAISGVGGLTGTYRWLFTMLGEFGESLPSNEVTLTASAGQSAIFNFYNVPAGVTGFNAYRTAAGGATGTETLLGYLTNVPPCPVPGNTVIYQMLDHGQAAPGAATAPAAATSTPPIWGLISWTRKASSYNRVWNGDFESGLMDGWYATAGLFNAPATSVGVTASPDTGKYAGQVIVTAAAGSGMHFPLFTRFKQGTTYTFTARAYSNPISGLTDSCWFILGTPAPGTGGSNDSTTVTFNINTTGYQTVTGTWTPSYDYDYADLAIMHEGGSGAGNICLDGVSVYETSQGAPTLPTQSYGRGGQPPFGFLDVASCIPSDLLNGTLVQNSQAGVANASPSGSYFINTAALTSVLDWWIDPGLYATPDDFSQGSIAIEIFAWGNWSLAANPRLVISAIADPSISLGVARYTQEYGSQGRSLISGSVNASRWSRVGTLMLPVNPVTPVRWKLVVTLAQSIATANTMALQGLVLAHVLRRACGPTGKSATDGTYPAWTSSTRQVIKTIRNDLRATNALAPTGNLPGAAALLPSVQGDDIGLTGSSLDMQLPSPTSGSPGTPGVPAVPATTTYATTILADSPIAYWPLDEANGSVAADLAGSHPGAYAGGFTLGQPGPGLVGETAVLLNGSTGDVTTGLAYPLASGSHTVEVWANLPTLTSYPVLWGDSGGSNSELFVDGSGNVYLRDDLTGGGTSVSWSAAWPGTAQWVHVVATIVSATGVIELFINGASKGAQTLSSGSGSYANFEIGQSGAGLNSWNGDLAKCAIYPTILSPTRIAAHYAAAQIPNTPYVPAVPATGVVPALTADHQLHVTLSNQVPDDPNGTAIAASSNLECAATIHASITPRYRLARFA